MDREDIRYGQYIQILKEELKPAMGCTEPIAIAYAAARARAVLGAMPERLLVAVSGNIIKNVKSVVVPHTGGLRGIPAAAAAGAVAGDADAELEVLSRVTEEEIAAMGEFLEKTPIEVRHADTGHIFDIQITAWHGADSSSVRIVDYHTNVVSVRRNDEILLDKEIVTREDGLTDRSCLTIEGIVDFAESVDTEEVREVLERQIEFNMAIAQEGLRHSYGANIGKTVLRGREYDVNYKMLCIRDQGNKIHDVPNQKGNDAGQKDFLTLFFKDKAQVEQNVTDHAEDKTGKDLIRKAGIKSFLHPQKTDDDKHQGS